jgi:hypothetical protein
MNRASEGHFGGQVALFRLSDGLLRRLEYQCGSSGALSLNFRRVIL